MTLNERKRTGHGGRNVMEWTGKDMKGKEGKGKGRAEKGRQGKGREGQKINGN